MNHQNRLRIKERKHVAHTLVWLSRKQRCVSTLSIQAEAIARGTSVGYAIHTVQKLQDIAGKNLPITILVDSLGLDKTLATQATPKDMSAMYDMHPLRLDFESESPAC